MRSSDAQNANTDSLMFKVGEYVRANKLIESGDAVVVGVSGGADSVAMLSVLRELSLVGKWRLIVAHLDHGLRDDSRSDAVWVGDLARRWSIDFVTERVDVSALADRGEGGIEQAARDARYAFFTRVARQSNAAAVAVGHHADDNVETVLHRIFRGTHLKGLSGMAASRRLCGGGQEQRETNLIRPLLGCTRAEVEDYCRRADLDWLSDSTNDDTRYTRNFIRHELLPLLRSRLNPRADEAVARLASAAADAEALIAAAAGEVAQAAIVHEDGGRIVVQAAGFDGVADVVAAATMRELLVRLGVPMRDMGAERLAELVALARGSNDGAVALSDGFEARRRGSQIVIGCASQTDSGIKLDDRVVELACPGRTDFGVWRIECSVEPLDREAFSRICAGNGGAGLPLRRVEMLDAGAVHGPISCRHRADGDWFHPLGSPGRQSVGDFLTNLKLDETERAEVACVCDADGIICLAPLRIAHRGRVTDSTKRVLTITISRRDG